MSFPGYAIKFSDGTWLGGCHGWYISDDPGDVDIHDTVEQAENNIKLAKERGGIDRNIKYTIVPAFEYQCYNLKRENDKLKIENERLKVANEISPKQIHSLIIHLESLTTNLKEKYKLDSTSYYPDYYDLPDEYY
jgi:hypothetical protein